MSAVGSFGGNVTATFTPSLATPTIDNVTVTSPDTEQSYAFPAGTKAFLLQLRGNGTLKLSLTSGDSGTRYWTLRPGAFLANDDIAASPTIYFQSPTAGLVLELFSWS